MSEAGGPARKTKGGWGWLLPPLAVHVTLCAAHLVFLERSPLLQYLTLDLKAYDTWARQVLAGNLLGKGVFYQDPLYPYLMALVYQLTGARVAHVLVVQILASAAAVAATAWLAAEIFSSRAARVAAWAAALYGPAVYYAGKPEKACLAALTVTLAFASLLRAKRSGRAWAWTFAGALFGLGGLLRGNVLLVALVAAALVLLTKLFVEAARDRFRAAAAFTLGVGAILLPVLARNYVLGGDWVFTTSQAGANLYIGNNAGNVTGTYAVPFFVRPSPEFEETDFRRWAEHEVGRPLLPSEVSSFYVGRVVRWAVEHPRRFLRLQLTKALAFVDHWEYPDNWSLYFVSEFSPVLRLPLVPWGVVVPLAVLGIAVSLRAPRRADQVWFALLAAAYAAAVVAFYVFSRYRFPIAFALIALAAHGTVTLFGWIREGRWRAAGAGAFLVGALLLVSYLGKSNDTQGDLSQRSYNLAASLLADGRVAEASELAHHALTVNPRNHLALMTLAEIASRGGDVDAERDYVARAYEARPDDEGVRVRMVRVNARAGGFEAAAQLAQAWLAVRESYEIRRALVGIALEQGLTGPARASLADLMARYPEDTWALDTALGFAVHDRDWGQAVSLAEVLRKKDPGELRWTKVLAFAYREVGDLESSERFARAAGLPWPLPPGAVLQDPVREAGRKAVRNG